MSAQKESPSKRGNAAGAEVVATHIKEPTTMNSTLRTEAFEAGRKRAADWFAQNGYSMCVFRDLRRAEYMASSGNRLYPEDCQAFDVGFATGLADSISGVRHG